MYFVGISSVYSVYLRRKYFVQIKVFSLPCGLQRVNPGTPDKWPLNGFVCVLYCIEDLNVIRALEIACIV